MRGQKNTARGVKSNIPQSRKNPGSRQVPRRGVTTNLRLVPRQKELGLNLWAGLRAVVKKGNFKRRTGDNATRKKKKQTCTSSKVSLDKKT